MDDIITRASKLFGIPAAAIIGPDRHHEISAARQACMYAARQTTPLKLEAIAVWLGRHHHTTVLVGLRAAKRRAEKDPQYAARLARLVRAL